MLTILYTIRGERDFSLLNRIELGDLTISDAVRVDRKDLVRKAGEC